MNEDEICIHELALGTCSICSGREEAEATRRVTLHAMVREAIERYGDRDRELVLRLVIAEVLRRDDAVELLLPALRGIELTIEGEIRRAAERDAMARLRALPGSPLGSTGGAKPSLHATPAAPFDEVPAIEASEPIGYPLVPRQLPELPTGVTLSEYTHQHQADLAKKADDWVTSFALSLSKTPVRIAGWRGTWTSATLDQVREKNARNRRLASGVANGLAIGTRVEQALIATKARTLDDYLKERQLAS